MRILIGVAVPLIATVLYSIGLFSFIYAVWSKWYPTLQNKFNHTVTTWVFKIGLNGLAGFGGYLYAHMYLNTLTGVDPNNFPKTLLAFTVPFAGYVWLLFITLGAFLVVTGYMLWLLGVMVWNRFIRFAAIFSLYRLAWQLYKLFFCAVGAFLKSLPDYATGKERYLVVTSFFDY
jgi:hypothetical protein